MLRPLAFLLATFALASTQSTQRARPAEAEQVPNTYFVRFHSSTTANGRADPKAAFHRKCAEKSVSYSVRYEYNDPDLFYGLSVSLGDDSDIETLKTLPEVASVAPVRWIQRPELDSSFDSTTAFSSNLSRGVHSTALGKRAAADGADFNSAHRLTGVSEAHAAGIEGSGVKIAFIDSGIDWRHPALGGCFGAGCKVAFGHDLVGDDYSNQNPVLTPKPDPLATCVGGFHGTHVAGIAGMRVPANATLFGGLVGVAPAATLGMYRVFGCTAFASEDVIVAAMQRAARDGADVVSMSLGGWASWGGDPASPYLELVAGLKRRGVAVIAAAGNNGESTPFFLSDPAIIPDALAVASVENTAFPTYGVRDSAGESHRYGALYPFPGGNYTAVLVGDGTARSEFGCYDENYARLRETLAGDLSGYVVVVRRGFCPVTVTQARAAANGFTKILTFPDPDSDNIFIQGYGVPTPAFDANGTIVSIGSTTDSTIYENVKAAGEYKLSFADPTPVLEKQLWGGQINNFSSVGPSWDFSLKPQIAAPGGAIISTFPLGGGGWAMASGTSMATPYLSGVYALVKSENPNLSVDEIFDFLKTTAKPLIQAGRDDYSPAAQQGAGLVSASSALFYKSTVSPSQLELGGTEKLATLSPNITLHNPSADAVTYTLGDTIANGMAFYPYGESAPDYAGWSDGAYLHLTPLPFSATVKPASTTITLPAGSATTITLPAGSATTIPFTITPPTGLSAREIPVYSGFLTATSSLNETFSVPYLGVPYAYSTAPLIGLDAPTPNVHAGNRSAFAAPQLHLAATGDAQGAHRAYAFADGDTPALRYSLLQPTRWTRVDVVAAEADVTATYYGYDREEVVDFARTSMRPNGTVGGVEVLGNLYLFAGDAPLTEVGLAWSFPLRDVTGTAYIGLKKGGYRVLARWLRFGGDEDVEGDWVSWLSGVVEATRDAYEGPVNGTVG